MFDSTQVKKFYSLKKEEFAQRTTSGLGGQKYGDRYGYTLKPPYTLEEIANWESKLAHPLAQMIRLDLIKYLTEVSREFFLTSYPHVFLLHSDNIGVCRIRPDEKLLEEFAPLTKWEGKLCTKTPRCRRCFTCNNPKLCKGTIGELCEQNDCATHCTDIHGVGDGMVKIGDGGCSFSTFMPVVGNHIGTLWESDGESLYQTSTWMKTLLQPLSQT